MVETETRDKSSCYGPLRLRLYWHGQENNEIIATITPTVLVHPEYRPLMTEELSIPKILPIGVVLFNILFLLVAIPIEAYILNMRLGFDKKSSIFYAISMNLFSGVIGWTIFFLIEPILPGQWRAELISYVFFSTFQNSNIETVLIFTVLVIFFTTFLIKVSLLKVLLITLNGIPIKEETQTPERSRRKRTNKNKIQNTNLVTTTLIANSLSYSAITLILLIHQK